MIVRERLDCRPPLGMALRSLADTSRPFALVGAWAGGGALLGCQPVRVAADSEDPFALIGGVARDPDQSRAVARDPDQSRAIAGGPDPGQPPGGQPEFGSGGPAVGGGWVGYLGYPLRDRVERLDPPPPRNVPMPAFVLAYYDHVIRRDAEGVWWFEALGSDERAGELAARLAWWSERLANPPPEQISTTGDWRLTPSPRGHAELVAACRERIYAGDLYQANICGEVVGRLHGSPLELFIRGVEALAPDRAAFLQGPWGAIVSLSPELFLERRGRLVRTAPIKGTRPRPNDPLKASAQRNDLAGSAKERAENVMIVDLMRNDLGRVCEPGTIVTGPLAEVRGHAGVWHLVSEVRGLLRAGIDDGQLLRATFPPGSVTGAPKIAAMNVISELESSAREVYTGAIGFASPLAGLELSVAIRTFEVRDSAIRLGVGGGVVADSDPGAEAAELMVKAAPLLDALGATLRPPPMHHDPAPCARVRGPAPRVRRLGPVPIPRPDARAGVIETLLVQNGRALRLPSHLQRLARSLVALYDVQPPAGLTERIEAAARAADGPARLRVGVLPGDGAIADVAIEIRALIPSAPVRLRVWTVPGGLGPHKWADRRLIEAMEARSPGELPLLVGADGEVLEASRASVFALGRDGTLRTPAADGRILPGIARAQVLAHADRLGHGVADGPLPLADLMDARGAVLTSALRLTRVLAVDGRPLDSDPSLISLVRSALNSG